MKYAEVEPSSNSSSAKDSAKTSSAASKTGSTSSKKNEEEKKQSKPGTKTVEASKDLKLSKPIKDTKESKHITPGAKSKASGKAASSKISKKSKEEVKKDSAEEFKEDWSMFSDSEKCETQEISSTLKDKLSGISKTDISMIFSFKVSPPAIYDVLKVAFSLLGANSDEDIQQIKSKAKTDPLEFISSLKNLNIESVTFTTVMNMKALFEKYPDISTIKVMSETTSIIYSWMKEVYMIRISTELSKSE